MPPPYSPLGHYRGDTVGSAPPLNETGPRALWIAGRGKLPQEQCSLSRVLPILVVRASL